MVGTSDGNATGTGIVIVLGHIAIPMHLVFLTIPCWSSLVVSQKAVFSGSHCGCCSYHFT